MKNSVSKICKKVKYTNVDKVLNLKCLRVGITCTQENRKGNQWTL